MTTFPTEVKNLINSLSQLPGIGPKTAERFVLFLLKKDKFSKKLAQNILDLKNIQFCKKCGNFSNNKICSICSDSSRNQNQILILAKPQEINVFENIHEYNGLYHVLGGLINTTKNIKKGDLNISGLIKRLTNKKGKLEVIFALDSTIQGESTMLFIKDLIYNNKNLKDKIKIYKIAKGIPSGGEISYADDLTLKESLKNK